MSKIIAQEIKDLGFTAAMFSPTVKQPDSEVVGTDGRNYVCILDHIAADDNKPVTGASWQTYWMQAGTAGEAWAAAENYKASFKTFVDGAISAKAAELEERIGTTAYNDAAKATYVKKAELCLTAAELVQRRINLVLGQAVGTPENKARTDSERKQRQDYLDQAEVWIAKLAQGITTDQTSDLAMAVITSTRFVS